LARAAGAGVLILQRFQFLTQLVNFIAQRNAFTAVDLGARRRHDAWCSEQKGGQQGGPNKQPHHGLSSREG